MNGARQWVMRALVDDMDGCYTPQPELHQQYEMQVVCRHRVVYFESSIDSVSNLQGLK